MDVSFKTLIVLYGDGAEVAAVNNPALWEGGPFLQCFSEMSLSRTGVLQPTRPMFGTYCDFSTANFFQTFLARVPRK
jgi:hypothetical protein